MFVDLKFNKSSDTTHRRTMTNFNNLFSVAFTATILILLARPNDSYAEIVSQPKASKADFTGLYPRLDVKQLSTTNLNNTLLFTLGARIAGELHFL